jgi:hypothetical protein
LLRAVPWSLALGAVFAASSGLLSACGVDGQTPDCSDPDAGCGVLVDADAATDGDALGSDAVAPEGGAADGAGDARVDGASDARVDGDARPG